MSGTFFCLMRMRVREDLVRKWKQTDAIAVNRILKPKNKRAAPTERQRGNNFHGLCFAWLNKWGKYECKRTELKISIYTYLIPSEMKSLLVHSPKCTWKPKQIISDKRGMRRNQEKCTVRTNVMIFFVCSVVLYYSYVSQWEQKGQRYAVERDKKDDDDEEKNNRQKPLFKRLILSCGVENGWTVSISTVPIYIYLARVITKMLKAENVQRT